MATILAIHFGFTVVVILALMLYDVAYLAGGYYFSDYFPNDAGETIDFSQYIKGKDRYNRYTHEVRLASDTEQRFRWQVGAFLQRQEHDIQQRYMITDLASAVSVTGWEDTIWLTKQLRVDKDWALFGEFSFDFTEKLTGATAACVTSIRTIRSRGSSVSAMVTAAPPARPHVPTERTAPTSRQRRARTSTRRRRRTARHRATT